ARDGDSRISLGEPEAAQGPHYLLTHRHRARRGRLGVPGPVSTQKSKRCRWAPLDRQLTRVQGGMVTGAQGDEVVRLVRPALRPRAQMMHIEVGSVSAARHDTAPAVAVKNVTAYRRGNGLRCPWRAHRRCDPGGR